MERQYHDLRLSFSAVRGVEPLERILEINCDAPGLLASQAYAVERQSDAKSFCWMGSEGYVQIKLPAPPLRSLICRLFIKPHSKVDLGDLKLLVNDVFADYRLQYEDGHTLIVFPVSASSWPHIEINLLGVSSVSPIVLGESEDSRLIAFRFYKAMIEYEGDDHYQRESL